MKRTIMVAILACLGLAALGAAIYSNTLASPFLFDSAARILDNYNFRIDTLSLDNLAKAAFHKPGLKSRPVANLTFALNYRFHAYDPTGYHVVNIVIHIINGGLLFAFIAATLRLAGLTANDRHRYAIAFLTTLIWFANPLHTQSVTYIVQRANSMAALFYLLAFWLYIQGRCRGIAGRAGWPWFFGATTAWLIALGCKQNAAILPFFILLYEWFFFQDLKGEWLRRRLLTITLVAAVLGAVALLLLGSDPLARLTSLHAFSKAQFTYGERILTQPRVIVYYLSLFLFPHPGRLNIDYDYPLSTSLLDPPTTLLSLLLIGAALATAVIVARKSRLLSFALFWYLGNLLIESSVIPLDIIFEHRTYLPSMLIPMMPVVWCFTAIRSKPVAAAVLLVPVGLFAVWTYERNAVWGDKITFWQDCVTKSPMKARPHFNLGAAYAEAENAAAAMEHYQRALTLDPNYAEVHNNIGNLLAKEERWNEAETEFRLAIAKRAGFHKAHYNLAVALRMQQQYDEARYHLQETIRLNPVFYEAYVNLGMVLAEGANTLQALQAYRQGIDVSPEMPAAHLEMGKLYAAMGDLTEAADQFRSVLAHHPDNSDALVNLGIIAAAQGDEKAALDYHNRALTNDATNASAHYNLAGLLMAQGRQTEAEVHYRAALRNDSTLVEAHLNLGVLLEEQGRANEALSHYREAVALKPDYAKAHNNMGNLFANQGDFEAALPAYRKAIRLDPDFDDAHANLGIALLRQGDAVGAEQAFRTALTINPSNLRAQDGLALLQSPGDSPPAQSPETLHRTAIEAAGRGEYDQAIQLFKQVLEMMPSEPGTLYNIACMYAKKGDAVAAVGWLERALDSGYTNWQAVRNDPDLDGIRDSEAFKALLGRLPES